jgi:hypothetical protein
MKHQDAAAQVLKYSGRYVESKGDEGLAFNWDNFLSALNNFAGDELTFDDAQTQSINQQDATVGVMVQKIADFMLKVLNVVVDVTTLTTRIESTFLNLKTQSSQGFLQFKKSSSGQNSSWEYRVLFAIDPHPENTEGNRFYSLVSSIQIEANISDESGWWGLTRETKNNYSAKITALELVVKDNFKAPPKTT